MDRNYHKEFTMQDKNQRFLKQLDILLLILFPVVSVVLSLALKVNFLTSTLLFFGLPALWFSLRTKEMVAKTLLFSALWAIPLSLFIDSVATISKAWFVPATVFPFRLFGVIPIEDLIWGFLFTYSVIIFYEHFLDKGKHELIDRRMKYLLWPWILLTIACIALLVARPELLVIRYAYFYLGLICVLLPTLTFLSFFPRLLSKYVKTASYFFLLALVFELTALHLNQWQFPNDGYFIGWIELFGYRFPFEEFFFWFVMGAIGVLAYYEFFDDDRK